MVWQLATELKHFRPRLGSSIVSVACSHGDQTFAISLESNGKHVIFLFFNYFLLAIHLVSGQSNEVENTLVSLYRALPGLHSNARVSTGLVYDPRTKCIVLNGSPGHLQYFDIFTHRVENQVL